MLIRVSPFPSIEAAREHAKTEIDRAAEEARLRHITPGSGQAMEYQRALKDAEAFLAGAIEYSEFLQADVDAGRAANQEEAAQLVLDTAAQWVAAGAQIRRIRLSAKAAVDNAQAIAEVLSIMRTAIEDLKTI